MPGRKCPTAIACNASLFGWGCVVLPPNQRSQSCILVTPVLLFNNVKVIPQSEIETPENMLINTSQLFSSKLKVSICAGVLLAVLSLSADNVGGNIFKTTYGTLIMFETVKSEDYDTLEYLRAADRVICKLLRRPSQKLQCRILLSANFKQDFNVLKVGSCINIYLPQNFSRRPDKQKLAGVLIRALLLTHSGIVPKERLNRIPDWLVTGVYGKLESKHQSQSILPVGGYPGLAALTLADELPVFSDSLNNALTPDEDGCAYELYRELCHFALERIYALSSITDNAIADIVILAAQEKYQDEEIFASTFGRLIIADYDKRLLKLYKDIPDNRGKIQRWFRHQANHRIINVFSPLPGKLVQEQFQKFRTIPYQFRNADNKQIAKCDLLELPRLFSRVESGRVLITGKSNELMQLINKTPMIIVSPMSELNTILLQIGNEPPPIVIRRLEKAVADVETAIKRQIAIESFMTAREASSLSPGLRYRREIVEVRRTEDVDWPSMKRFLDEVEKSYLND